MQAISLFKSIFTVSVIALLSACGNSGVEVSTSFSSVQGIEEGTAVYFEESVVGEVTKVENEGSGSIVTLDIDDERAGKISSNSAVVVNRIKPGGPLEIHASGVPSDTYLQEGQTLEGLNSMFDLVAWSVGDAFQAGTGEITGYVDSFQTYLEGEGFQEDKAIIEQGVREMANTATATLNGVEQELQAVMAELNVTEEDLAQAIRKLGDEMSPLAQEMAKSGTDLALELEKFARGIETGSLESQESGQKLIEAMLAAIEQLNQSVEDGTQESLDNNK